MPIRNGYARDVFVVTSGEKMSLYAAGNIFTAVQNFRDRGYASVRGIILNHRNVPDELQKVQAFAQERNTAILAEIPRSDDISRCEELGQTVVQGAPESPAGQAFLTLARKLLAEGRPLA